MRTMATENLTRITVFAHRNPAISEEEFHAHWVEKHAPLVSAWLQRHGIVKYTQVCNTLSSNHRLGTTACHYRAEAHNPSTTPPPPANP